MSTITHRYKRTILGTCCVPWNEDGTFAEAIFRDQVRGLIGMGLRDLYIFGTAGEGYAVTETQFDAITAAFAAEMKAGGSEPMVGVVGLSLGAIIERIERAVALGVREFQISLPSWGALTPEETAAFFRAVCGRFPDSRFLHYNLLRSKRLVAPAEYVRIAAENPNLVATKHGTADIAQVNGLMAHVPHIRHFITETAFPWACMIGEPGFLISIAASNPARAREFYEAGVARDVARVTALHAEIGAMTSALMAAVGGAAHMDGAYDKIFCRLHDPRFPLRLLPPYGSTTDQGFETYKRVLTEKFPQWLPALNH